MQVSRLRRFELGLLLSLVLSFSAVASYGLPCVIWVPLPDQDEPIGSGLDGLAGKAFFEMGSFGSLELGLRQDAEATRFLETFVAERLAAVGGESHVLRDSSRDELGSLHLRYEQTIHGLRVIGVRLVVHVDAATGEIRGVNGHFVPGKDVVTQPELSAEEALAKAIATAKIGQFELGEKPELVFLPAAADRLVLAWRGLVAYQGPEGPRLDDLFADAATGEYLARHPRYHTAKRWDTYNGKNEWGLPGFLRCVDGGGCGIDAVAQAAHNNASAAYDYFKHVHGRDSFDAAGAIVVGTVRHGCYFNNAYWNGYQMAFGTGDGVVFSDLGSDADVVVHELAHGVTQFEANLVYAYESGALNEAFSDVFAAAAAAWRTGSVSAATWRIGELAYTPSNPGDALRYMSNPTQDGASRDYYPTRYVGTADNGGVHWNSGIANLAFYLLSQGGRHPRNVTTNTVPAIGIDKAARIFYRALTTYLVPASSFADARAATAQAAADLYGAGSAEVTAVHQAWCAVGVPGCPPSNLPPVPAFTYTCAGLACEFDATSSTDDGTIVDYRWTFGTLTATGITAFPFFPSYGAHVVSLRVTDQGGSSATKTETIVLQAPVVEPVSGSWHNPKRSGNTISITRSGTIDMTLYWFTFLADGSPIWYISDTLPFTGASWSGNLHRVRWNGASPSSVQVGTVTLTFSDPTEAWFSWVLDGQPGGERFKHLVGGAERTGAWYYPPETGWGYILDESNGTLGSYVAIYDGSEPRWLLGTAPASGDATIPVRWFTGPGLCPGCNPSPPPATSQPAGSIRLQIPTGASTTGSTATTITLPSGNTWNRGTLPIFRLTFP